MLTEATPLFIQELLSFTVAWLQHIQLLWSDVLDAEGEDDACFMAAGQEEVQARLKAPDFFTATSMYDYFPDREILMRSAVFTANMLARWTLASDNDVFGGKGFTRSVKKVIPTEELGHTYNKVFELYTVRASDS